MNPTLDDLRRALALEGFDDRAARRIMSARPRPSDPIRPWRDGSVLILFFPGEEGLTVVLTRRTDRVEHHSGQISFPGGAREDGEPHVETALRETEEEIGVARETLEVLGELPLMRIPASGFEVRPFVAFAANRPDYSADPGEVAGVIEVPFHLLFDPELRSEEEQEWRGTKMRVPCFELPDVGRPPLWGATAMMLSGLVERLRAL